MFAVPSGKQRHWSPPHASASELVAVRGADGKLSALSGRGSTFELARWLEHDGDGRPVADAGKAQAFLCDKLGCTAQVKGVRIAVSRSAAALRDDCAMASIMVLQFSRPKGCRQPAAVIDSNDVSARGAHALTIDDGSTVVTGNYLKLDRKSVV